MLARAAGLLAPLSYWFLGSQAEGVRGREVKDELRDLRAWVVPALDNR